VLDDARTFALRDRYQAVVSLFDSLNHVMEPSELAAVFANVHDALAPGGRFLFDLNTELAFLERWDDDFGFVEDDHAVVVRVTYDPAARIGRFDATVFREEPQARGRWRRSDVMLLQRPYEADAVCAALGEAGFTGVRSFDAEQELALEGHVGRVFYLARRPITARPH
jgi:SAM-dependent methyltransferase